MGSSESQQETYSFTNQTSKQHTAQGSTGDNSPTVVGENVTVTDGGTTQHAIDKNAEVVIAALEAQGEMTGSSLDLVNTSLAAAASGSDRNAEILSSVLENNNALAQNVQSGGATVALKNYNLVVLGLLALGALFLFRKS